MNARIECPFLWFGCAGMTLQTTRSLCPTTSRLLSSNASLNDADRWSMLPHTTRHVPAMIRGPRSRKMGYAARGPLAYTLCPNVKRRAACHLDDPVHDQLPTEKSSKGAILFLANDCVLHLRNESLQGKGPARRQLLHATNCKGKNENDTAQRTAPNGANAWPCMRV